MRYDGESKHFPDKQRLRNSTSLDHFTTNVKGTSLGRKHRRKKRPTQNKPKTIKMVIHINNYLKCKWIKCTNQKTDWLEQ